MHREPLTHIAGERRAPFASLGARNALCWQPKALCKQSCQSHLLFVLKLPNAALPVMTGPCLHFPPKTRLIYWRSILESSNLESEIESKKDFVLHNKF